MTSSVGARWNGSEFEVGFTAGTREEFEAHLEKVRAFADHIWTPAANMVDPRGIGSNDRPTQDIIRDIEEQARNYDEAARAKGPVVKKSWAQMNAAERQAYREQNGLA